jgi:nitroreductase
MKLGESMPNHPAFSAIEIGESEAHEEFIHPLLAQRRSQRAFSSKPVEPEKLSTLLEAARWAPSSFNEQPWSFIVTTRQNKPAFELLLGCLLEYNVRWAQHAPVLILSVARLTLASSGEPNRHALHDVGQATASLTFQANSCGLTVCQMAGFDVEKARDAFSIPPDHEPVAVAAIGYPGDPTGLPEKLRQKELTPQQRKPFQDFVFEGRWGVPAAWIRNGE